MLTGETSWLKVPQMGGWERRDSLGRKESMKRRGSDWQDPQLSWTLPTTDCENPAWHRIDISKLHELRHLSGL